MQLIEVEGSCTKIVGRCSAGDCATHCNTYANGARVLGTSCSYHNLCTCTFDRPPPGSQQPACDIGMGECTRDCYNDCCNQRCKNVYKKTGAGSCLDIFDMELCVCTYQR